MLTAKDVAKKMSRISLRMMMLEPEKRRHWKEIFDELDKLRIVLLEGKANEVAEKLHKEAKPIWSGSYTSWLGWGWGAHPKGGWEEEKKWQPKGVKEVS